MQIKFSLSHKGLILVAVVLAFELLFVGALNSMLAEAEQVAAKESRSKEIVGKTNHIFQLYDDEVRTVRAFQDAGYSGHEHAERFFNDHQKLIEEARALSQLVHDNPAQIKTVESIEHSAIDLNRILTKGFELFESNRPGIGAAYIEHCKPDIYKAKKNLQNGLQQLMTAQEKIIAESPAAQAHARQDQKKLLQVGILLNILFTLALALFFVRGITSRVQMVAINSSRLVRGQPLNPLIKGSDEIAELDRVFHEMADALTEAARLKQEFVAMISHDLRTPLTSVKGFLHLLSQDGYGAVPQKVKDRTQLAERNVARLISLIDDLLAVEKLEAGKLDISPELIPLSPVISRSVEAVRVFAEEHAVSLQAEPVEINVFADGDRLVQVLVNLLSNAVKFSPPNSVVMVSVHEQDDWVELRVTDSGCGIPADHLESVFDRFKQVRASDDRKKGGTGLGLAICKSIVEQHGGTVGVTSQEGKGSTFFFRIPTRQTP
jgi:signal transduction histidine kinase